MGRKLEITGKAVIYTKDGVKVVDAEVRRKFNVYLDRNYFKFNFDGDYLLIGGARTVPTDNIYASPVRPEIISKAVAYARTKFFRVMLDLMRLAQWEPIHASNVPLDYDLFQDNRETDLPLDGESLYKRYGFNDAMIRFTEAHYHDDICDKIEE